MRKDLARLGESAVALRKFSVGQLIEICGKAGGQFLQGTLPLGDKGHTQSPQQYVETLSSTSGLPHVMVRRNLEKIHLALTNIDPVSTMKISWDQPHEGNLFEFLWQRRSLERAW